MKSRFARVSIRSLALPIALAWLAAVTLLHFSARSDRVTLKVSSIQHEQRCAYVTTLTLHPPAWPVMVLGGDTLSEPDASDLEVLEDGRSIGAAHSAHDEVRSQGGGRFSYWKDSLYFSSADCTDPRTNGRRYQARVTPVVALWARVLAWLSAAYLVYRTCQAAARVAPLRRAGRRGFEALLSPIQGAQRKRLEALLGALILLPLASFLWWTWSHAQSAILSVAGFFQISDASYYWICANSLLQSGNFGDLSHIGNFCQRRALYPTLLSGIAWLGHREIFSTLLIQAVISACALWLLVRRCVSDLRVIGAIVTGALLLCYTATEAVSMTMTENGGLIFGCLGVALLIAACERSSLATLAAGVGALSLAESARAGALFLLPSLVVWAGLIAWRFRRRWWLWSGVALLAASSGFLLQAALVGLAGGDLSNSYGSFSYVLYGLSQGGKSWLEAIHDFPMLASNDIPDAVKSRMLYAAAWHSISLHPEWLLGGLRHNLERFLADGSYGFERLGGLAKFAWLCWWLAWIPMVRHWKQPLALLLVAGSIGISLSACLLLMDGGARVFAATEAIDALQVSVGFVWLALCLSRVAGFRTAPLFDRTAGSASRTLTVGPRLETAFALLLVALLVLPHAVPASGPASVRAGDVPCAPVEPSVYTELGSGGTQVLRIVGTGAADFGRGAVRLDDLRNGIPKDAWWRDGVLALPETSLLIVYQDDRTDPTAPGPYWVVSPGDVSGYWGHRVHLCLGETASVEAFGNQYLPLRSIRNAD